MTLSDELFNLIRAFDTGGIEYAVCGGLAMAILGHPRTTQDLDILMPEESIERAAAAARDQGFTIDAGWMEFGGGTAKIYRLSKVDKEHHDLVPLDLIAVTPQLRIIWQNRVQVDTQDKKVWTVSRDGLIAMKKISGRKQDMADIENLESDNEKG